MKTEPLALPQQFCQCIFVCVQIKGDSNAWCDLAKAGGGGCFLLYMSRYIILQCIITPAHVSRNMCGIRFLRLEQYRRAIFADKIHVALVPNADYSTVPVLP